MNSRKEAETKDPKEQNAMAKQKGDFYGRGLALQCKPLQDIAHGETLQATDVPATSKPAEVCKRGK